VTRGLDDLGEVGGLDVDVRARDVDRWVAADVDRASGESDRRAEQALHLDRMFRRAAGGEVAAMTDEESMEMWRGAGGVVRDMSSVAGQADRKVEQALIRGNEIRFAMDGPDGATVLVRVVADGWSVRCTLPADGRPGVMEIRAVGASGRTK
jgi:hypothetical protein